MLHINGPAHVLPLKTYGSMTAVCKVAPLKTITKTAGSER